VHDAFPRYLIVSAAALSVIGIVFCVTMTLSAIDSLSSTHAKVERLATLRGEILLHDETLSTSAMLAATTGDARWIDRYRATAPRLEQAIEAAIDLADDPQVHATVNATFDANTALVSIEMGAMDLVHEGRARHALDILESEVYERHKRDYRAGMATVSDRMLAIGETALRQERLRMTLAESIGAGTLVLLVGLWTLALRRLARWRVAFDRESSRRQAAEGQVRRLAEGLERKVRERTRALAHSA